MLKMSHKTDVHIWVLLYNPLIVQKSTICVAKNLNCQPVGFQGTVRNDNHDILPIILDILQVNMNKLSCFEHMGWSVGQFYIDLDQ